MLKTQVHIGRGLTIKNPVMTASGTFGYGLEYGDFIDLNRLGGVLVKGTTLHPRQGNPYPRMAETPSGMLNAVGLQNKGVDYFCEHIYPTISGYDTAMIVNVSGSQVEDYIETAEKIGADVLLKENVKVGLAAVSREEAITTAGKLLVAGGYVDEGYVQGMLNREQDLSTYIGKGIAIPHGENAVKDTIKKTGIVVLQYPEGVKFGDETAHLVIGIAGVGNDHLAILANIATMVGDYTDEQLEELFKTKSADELYEVFTKAD